MGNPFSWFYKEQQPSGKMADGSKKASGLGMADGSKKASGLGMADGSKKLSAHGVKPGALIEISRKNEPYEDWALCVAENEVFHVVELSPTKSIIKQEKLENVVGSDQWRVNHFLDDIYDAREIQDILEDIRKFKDTEVPNDLFTNNCKHMVTNRSFGKPESRQVKPGDMIEISRMYGLYKHWALCVAENEVMHVVRTAPKKYMIKQEKLEKAVGSDQWRVNNYLDGKYVPRDTRDILEDALKMKDTEVPYNLLAKNCEHMVTDWRYGKPKSRQVQMAELGSLVVLLTVVGTVLHRKKSKKEGHQRSSTGPTKEGEETVSKEEAKPPHDDTNAFGRQRSSTGPTKDGGEKVSEEEDGLQDADALVWTVLALIITFVVLRFNTRSGKWQKGFQRNTCGSTEEGGETVSEEEAMPLPADTTTESKWAFCIANTSQDGGETVSEKEAMPPHADTTTESRQRSTCGPKEERGGTVSEVKAIPPLDDDTAFVVAMLIFPIVHMTSHLRAESQNKRMEESLQKSSTGPTKEGEETVSKEEAKPPHADTPAEREPVQRQLRH